MKQPKLYSQAETAGLTSMEDICDLVDSDEDINPEYIAKRAINKLDAAFINFVATGLFLTRNKDDLVVEEQQEQPEDPDEMKLAIIIADEVTKCMIQDEDLTLNAFKIIADLSRTKEEAARMAPLVMAIVQLREEGKM